MADNTEAADATETTPTTETAETSPEVEPARAETDWKAEARKWEERAKTNRAAAKQRDELAQALKAKDADIEALRAKVAGFEHASEVEAWKRQVSTDTGVPADLLRGDTLEDLQAHAEVLKKALTSRPRGPYVPDIDKTPEKRDMPMADLAGALFGQK
ncbi:MAG: hypothetical protein KIA99_04435 [Actinomyces urogenitalis]|uniref:hypothetical protein n=1 Tax=Actinomyces urogenitalis TaxID=103621 RepID=UPI00242EF024|nr:hypothetical protein [Actinomyces urogenitalis]MBS5976833.1 hypothetical protein [Actinomyces urogenitalis]MDU7427937.1 hypothetical protein [Actinomyces urogenitalis]